MSGITLASFFQLGYVCQDVRQAVALLERRYGIRQARFREHAMMAQAHFYVGATLFELIEPRAGAPAIYHDFLPVRADAIRLQHKGYMVETDAQWNDVTAEIDRLGISTDLRGSILEGELKFIYADTLHDLGHYTEYVYLSGRQKHEYYADVPVNGA